MKSFLLKNSILFFILLLTVLVSVIERENYFKEEAQVIGIEKKAVNQINKIDKLSFSPSGRKICFMERQEYNDKRIPDDRQVIIYVGNSKKNYFKEIYHGSLRTSGWEWLNENEILVHYNCGTECQSYYLINVDTGEKYVLVYGVNYEWSPNRELVLAYHYSWGYGITVGDRNGNELVSIVRKYNYTEDEKLIEETKAVWSPDSKKLALIINSPYAQTPI